MIGLQGGFFGGGAPAGSDGGGAEGDALTIFKTFAGSGGPNTSVTLIASVPVDALYAIFYSVVLTAGAGGADTTTATVNFVNAVSGLADANTDGPVSSAAGSELLGPAGNVIAQAGSAITFDIADTGVAGQWTYKVSIVRVA